MISATGSQSDQDRSGLTVRPARPRDAEAVADLLHTAPDLAQVSPDETFPLTPETVRHWIEKRRAGYVLERRGKVMGYAELVDDAREPDRVWIGHMMVAPSQRGLGLGRKLVQALLEVAERDRDAAEIAISAFEDNVRALRCYRGCGFRDRETHRVNTRQLVEMRYRVPGRRPLVPLPAVLAILAMAAALVTIAAVPAAPPLVLTIPMVSIASLAAWALHPVLPIRRDAALRRVLRLLAYCLAVGSSAVLVAALLALAVPVDLPRVIISAAAASVVAVVGLIVHVQWAERRART